MKGCVICNRSHWELAVHMQSTWLSQLQHLPSRSWSCLHCSLEVRYQLTGMCLTCWGTHTGHPQGLWLLWLLAVRPWDCSHISMGTLLAAVRINFSRSLEANHTFWSPHWHNQLDLCPSWRNDGKAMEPSLYHIWLPLSEMIATSGFSSELLNLHSSKQKCSELKSGF